MTAPKKKPVTQKEPVRVKTYAVKGLIEWQLALNIGGAILKLKFTGGRMGTNGVLPAKFTTDSKALQQIIEKSDHFRKQKIFLYADYIKTDNP